MKITERESKRNVVLFKDLHVGEVFRTADNDGYTYMKVNDGELNATCLDDGDLCHIDEDIDSVLLDAELIVSEVTE